MTTGLYEKYTLVNPLDLRHKSEILRDVIFVIYVINLGNSRVFNLNISLAKFGMNHL